MVVHCRGIIDVVKEFTQLGTMYRRENNKVYMKKLGLITFYKDNYGSILQCYATKCFIEQQGFQCEILYLNNSSNKLIRKAKTLANICLNSMKFRGYFKHYLNMRKAHKTEKVYLSKDSLHKMDLFIQTKLCPQGYPRKELKKIGKSDAYSAFIAGSDQIWNTSITPIDSFYFLKFAPMRKRIALAPSFGIENVSPCYWRSIKKGLYGFEHLSAREESGKKLMERLTHKNVARLADPTFFLNDNQWRKFCANVKLPDEKYIFMHFLGQPSQIAVDAVNCLADYHKCRVICFANEYREKVDVKDVLYVSGGPEDYVGFIDHATAICTDSFHTTLFSINLHTVFFTFIRQYWHDFPQNARIVDLLERYGLTDRLVTSIEQMQNLFHSRTEIGQCVIDAERNSLIHYMRNELTQKLGEK